MAKTIEQFQKDWHDAYKRGDKAGMDAAHSGAEAVRVQSGYSGGADGSQHIKLNNNAGGHSGSSGSSGKTGSSGGGSVSPSNRYQTTVYDQSGRAQQGYIENGATYLSNGQRLPDGYKSIDAQGRTWLMQGGKGVPATAAAAYTQKHKSGTYAGDRYITRDGFNIDMSRDYSAEIAKAIDPQERRMLEEARNVKIAQLQAAGITNYNPTYDYADVDIGDTLALTQAYDEWERAQNSARNVEIRAAREGANADLEELAAQREQLGDSHADELRQAWVKAQLSRQGLAESLAARGITGGLAETAALDLDSAYQSNYANLERLYGQNLAGIASNEASVNNSLGAAIRSIRNSYGTAVADSYRNYLTQKAQVEAAARNDIIRRLGL